MRSSLLPRRVVLGAVLSVSLVGAGLAAFAADPTAGCSFTDPVGDATIPDQGGSPDQDLDLVTVGYSTNDTSLLLSAKVKKLTGSGPDLFAGDDFEFNLTVNKKALQIGVTRIGDPNGGPPLQVSPYAYVNGTDSTASAPSLKATYDLKTSVVEVSVSSADVSKLAGAPVAGAAASALSVRTLAYTGGPERASDTAAPKAGTTWTYGAASCDGGTGAPAPTGSASAAASPSASASAAPSGSASPSASGTASPSASSSASASGSASPTTSGAPAAGATDGPTPGCADISDAKGDASPNATNPGAPTPNDPDLDILAVNFQTEPETLKGYLKIDKLSTKPSNGNGHRFDVMFTAGTKTVEVYGGQPDSVAGGANSALVAAGQSSPAAGGVRIAGTYNATVKTSSMFDVKNSRVVLSVDRATLDKALGAPLADGTVVKATSAHSRIYTPTAGSLLADTAQATKPEEQVYTVGDNKCFAAVAAPGGTPTVTVSAPARVQTSDRAAVAVTFTDSAGKPVSGAAVTARIGAGPVSHATTDDGGRASFAVAVVDSAGARTVLVAYSGDAMGAGAFQVRRDIAVLAEVSKIAYRSSGTGTVHSFTITLTDDDAPTRHPYAGTVVKLAYSGKTVSVRTDMLGRASVQARPGAHVDISYAGRSGYVRPATARTVVT